MESGNLINDPYGSYFFALEIGGIQVAHFQEFSGIKTSSEVFEIQEGGRNGATIKRPGQSKFENLVLKYATSASVDLLEWRDDFLQDRFVPRNGSVSIINNRGDEVRRYNFTNAWPVSWEGPTLNSGSSDLAIETLEIAIEGLQIEDPTPPKERVATQAPASLDRNNDGRVDDMNKELASRTDRTDTPNPDQDGDGEVDGMDEEQVAREAQSEPAPTSDDDEDGQVDGGVQTQSDAEPAPSSDSDDDGQVDGMAEQQAEQRAEQRESAPTADADGDGQIDPPDEDAAKEEPGEEDDGEPPERPPGGEGNV
ncbi:MAG: phage tail protein [Myxococcota bacterium]